MNGEQFDVALTRCKRGEWMAYHSGILMSDRLYHPEVDSCAAAARRAYEEGRCLLVQQRVSPMVCQYLAVKLATPKVANVAT